MAVALNHLRSDGRDIEAEALANSLFHFRAEVRGVADGAGNFSYGHLRSGVAETLLVAFVFGEPVGDFQAEGNGLGVNTVGAADLRCMAKFLSAFGEHVAEFDEGGFDEPRSVADEESLGGVNNIVGGHAVMEPARSVGIADGFANRHGEGNYAMLPPAFEPEDPGTLHFRASANPC